MRILKNKNSCCLQGIKVVFTVIIVLFFGDHQPTVLTTVLKMQSTGANRFTEVRVREAKAEDLDEIHKMMGDLMVFQKVDYGAVEIEHFKKNSGLIPPDNKPYFHIFVAEAADSSGNKSIAGYTLDYFQFKTGPEGLILYLEDIFVKESCRGLNVGYLLLKEAAKRTREHQCTSLKLQCLEDNVSRKFYEKHGGKWKDRSGLWLDFYFDQQAIDNLINGK